MNTKIWRNDRELMVFVNSTGSALLAEMKGAQVLSKIIEQVFSEKGKELSGAHLGDFDFICRASLYEDRFIQAASFTISLWLRGFVSFIPLDGAIKADAGLGIVKKFYEQKKQISIQNVLEEFTRETCRKLSRFNRRTSSRTVKSGLSFIKRLDRFRIYRHCRRVSGRKSYRRIYPSICDRICQTGHHRKA